MSIYESSHPALHTKHDDVDDDANFYIPSDSPPNSGQMFDSSNRASLNDIQGFNASASRPTPPHPPTSGISNAGKMRLIRQQDSEQILRAKLNRGSEKKSFLRKECFPKEGMLLQSYI